MISAGKKKKGIYTMFDRIRSFFGGKKQPSETNRYEGELVNGVREGKGTMYYQGGHMYKGEWHNGLRHGFGEFLFASGEHYVGSFVNDLYCGMGKITYPSGDVYDGHFMNGKRDGDGTLTCKDGRRFEGNWLNDKMNGVGALYYPDGSVFRGIYVNSIGIDGFTTKKDKDGNWVRERYVRPELKDIKGCEVVLVSCPYENKMQMIKAVREITGYGLALAKDIVENLPQWVVKGVTLEAAVQIRKVLEAAGGVVEVR